MLSCTDRPELCPPACFPVVRNAGANDTPLPPATPAADDASEPSGYRVSLDLTTGDITTTPVHIPDASTDASEPLTEAEREALAAAIGITTVRPSAHPKFPGGIAAAVERVVAAREAAAATKTRAEALGWAADEVHRESRWSLEKAMRGDAQDCVDRLLVVERCIRDEAKRSRA